ncbi:MAG: hypothetical protein QOE45_1, partial [Frankiaceae bacterium]|nr:hypothetical protein [Frankiaceae bacterium]
MSTSPTRSQPSHPSGLRRRGRGRSWPWTARPFAREIPRFLGISDTNDHAVLRHRDAATRRLLAAADGCAAVLALLLVGELAGRRPSALSLIVAVPLVVGIHKMAGLYDRDDMVLRRSTLDELPTLLQLSALYGIIASAVVQAVSPTAFRPAAVLGVWVLAFVLISLGRLTARGLARAIEPPERCLIVGDQGMIEKVVEKIRQPGSGGRVVATLPWTASAAKDTAASLGIEALIRVHNVHRVIIAPATSDAADTVDLIRIAKEAGVRVSILPRMFEAVGTSVEFEQVDGLTMLGVRRFGLTRSSRLVKRAFDLIAATVG